MNKRDSERLERISWIIQVFDPKRLPNVHAYNRWMGVHCSVKHGTVHQVEEHEADQYDLEKAIEIANYFAKSVDAKDWQNFDWSVYNFRTLERIPISAL